MIIKTHKSHIKNLSVNIYHTHTFLITNYAVMMRSVISGRVEENYKKYITIKVLPFDIA